MATGEPFRTHPPMITLEDDRLSFTFPEIARQLRAHVERQIGHILPEFLRPEERTALLAELESRWGFRQLDGKAQDRHRLRVRTLTADEIEAALRTAALRAAGLHDASFPALTIAFQRTLRIPDDGRTYPLPAGLGAFPLRSVDDFPATAPASWLQRGGVVLPMYQSEALWISFSARYPCAVKIAAGKINAVSGEAWTAELHSEPQDYVVVPGQPWLDGFSVGEGLIRQFVAMPLGAGDSVEEQLTGRAEHRARGPDWRERPRDNTSRSYDGRSVTLRKFTSTAHRPETPDQSADAPRAGRRSRPSPRLVPVRSP